jgi:hypothetical protein
MSRIAALKPRASTRASDGVVAGTAAMAAVGRTICAICDASALPTPFDVVGTIPTTDAALVRRVVGFNLWLWFRPAADRVSFIMVTPTPPVPAE